MIIVKDLFLFGRFTGLAGSSSLLSSLFFVASTGVLAIYLALYADVLAICFVSSTGGRSYNILTSLNTS